MNWILGYFGVGAVVFSGLLLDNRVRNRRSSGRISSLMADIRRKKRSWLEFVMEEVLVGGVAAVGVLVAWPLVLSFSIYFYGRKDKSPSQTRLMEPTEFSVSHKDLLQTFTVGQIEDRELIQDPLGAVPPIAFGHLNKAWQRFAGHAPSSDTLWSFRAPWGRYGTMSEWRSGYARVRNNEIVGWFTKSIKPVVELAGQHSAGEQIVEHS